MSKLYLYLYYVVYGSFFNRHTPLTESKLPSLKFGLSVWFLMPTPTTNSISNLCGYSQQNRSSWVVGERPLKWLNSFRILLVHYSDNPFANWKVYVKILEILLISLLA